MRRVKEYTLDKVDWLAELSQSERGEVIIFEFNDYFSLSLVKEENIRGESKLKVEVGVVICGDYFSLEGELIAGDSSNSEIKSTITTVLDRSFKGVSIKRISKE